MRELAPGIFLENKYPGVRVAAVASSEGLLLVDCPTRAEDAREWVAALATQGRPRYLAVLDHHPDRVLGARGFDFPIIAHDLTRQAMQTWPDTFKGNSSPIGAEADRLKRITGVRRAIPEVTFADEIKIFLGEREIYFRHRPGPTAGAIWVDVPQARVVFIGDAVWVSEPPYLGEADLEAWLTMLESLRQRGLERGYLISAHDGRIGMDDIHAMARFLRKVPPRLERLHDKGRPAEAAASLAPRLLEGFRLSSARREQALLRLQTGLVRLYSRTYGKSG